MTEKYWKELLSQKNISRVEMHLSTLTDPVNMKTAYTEGKIRNNATSIASNLQQGLRPA